MIGLATGRAIAISLTLSRVQKLTTNNIMKSLNNNGLRTGALLSLYITSYIPLFLIIIIKQLNDYHEYLHWAGLTKSGIKCFWSHFGMSSILGIVSIAGLVGIWILINNLETNLPNGQVVEIVKISNRNSEAIGYIATYIVPFLASDFSSIMECGIFVVVMALIYIIYTNSNMILINPILSIKYSLLEVDYKIVGDKSDETHDALIITDTKDFKEKVNYNIYQIGFKLFYGKERKQG